MNKTIAIIQPSFLPWRGYFHIIKRSDVFVFYDDVQYDKNGWRNRNQIKGHDGKSWITVPVITKSQFGQAINETQINNTVQWQKKILGPIRQAYLRTPHFKSYFSWLEDRFAQPWSNIADLDVQLTKDVAGFFNFACEFHISSQLEIEKCESRVERLVKICRALEANHYLTGPSARDYIEQDNRFLDSGIELEYIKYDFPNYPQGNTPFDGQVSILDLLFYCGADSRYL